MKHFAGLDGSLEETAIRVVDEAGAIIEKTRAASEPRVLARGKRLARVPLPIALRDAVPLLLCQGTEAQFFPWSTEGRAP